MTVTQELSVLPVRDPDAPLPTRRRIRRWTPRQFAILAATVASSLSLAWVLYYRLTPGAGGVGFALVWFAICLTMYWHVVQELEGPRLATDRTVTVALTAVALSLVAVLGLIIGDVSLKGAKTLRLNFFTETLQSAGPLSKATEGGAMHSIIGTAEQVGLSLLMSVPLAVFTAVYLNEVKGRLARAVRTVVDAMSGVPAIVAGLFIYGVWVLRVRDFSGFAAALALSILMLPVVTRTVEEVLRLVPQGLREAAAGLGAPAWRTTWRVVLPTAKSGLVTAILLGVARAVGDTAALISTAAGFDRLNANPFKGQQDSLALFVFKQVKVGLLESQTQRAYTGAFVLISLILLLFVTARVVSRPKRAR
jgi:phosphate transport system permease protein